MSANDDDEQHPTVEDGQEQQQSTQTTTKKKKVTVLRKISAKPAPKKTSPKRPTTDDAVLPATNNRGQNDDDQQQSEQQQQQAPAPRPTATRKSASPKPQAKKSATITRSAEQNDFDAAVAFLHATAPSQASIITANAVAAVEARERKEAEEQQQRRRQAEEELERQKEQQQSATAASAATSSEPLLSCSECHQQLPKSEFSSSQAKKLVGRKCKQCVVKVAEIEAQLREEAAVNLAQEKINAIVQKINELPQLEQVQRKTIAEEEGAAFERDARDAPEMAYLRQLNKTLGVFLATRDWPKPDDPRRPVFHEWFFSMESGREPSFAILPVEHRPTEQAAALMLRDKGWTLAAAFELLAFHAARDNDGSANVTQLCVCALLHLINNLIDAGALDLLPRPWRNEHNPMQQIKLLFRDSFQRLVQRLDPLQLSDTSMPIFGMRVVLGFEFFACVLRILQHGDTQTATATEDDVVDFLKFMIDAKVSAYHLKDGSTPVFTPAMSNLIRFLFIAPASDNSSSSQTDEHAARCFVARLLGLKDNNIPERIVSWLAVLMVHCDVRLDIKQRPEGWYELVADLLLSVPPSVVACLLRKEPPSETRNCYESFPFGPGGEPVFWTSFHSILDEHALEEPAMIQRARVIAVIDEAGKMSADPVFKQLLAPDVIMTFYRSVLTNAAAAAGGAV